MKKVIITSLAIALVAVACKSKQATASSSAPSNMDAQLAAVQTRFPDATKAELQKGQEVYTGPCTRCHGAKDVTAYTEPKLLEIVDNMAAKANISAAEKQALIRFAVGVRATASK